MDSAAGQDECAVVDAPAAPAAPIEEEPEPQPEQEQEPSVPSPVVAEQEPQQPPQPPAEPEADEAVEEAAGMGAKRKASAGSAAEEEEEAPALKHLKSPGVMLSRRPLPTSGIKPPAIFAPKRVVPSPVPFPTAPAACPKPAAVLGSSARKSVAAATTTSHRMSVLSKKVGGQATNQSIIHLIVYSCIHPIKFTKLTQSPNKSTNTHTHTQPVITGPTPFGPGTYSSANSKVAAKTTAAPTGSSAGPAVSATASAKAALLKERPKINYRPHTGKLRPFFSPKPFLAPQQEQQQRRPLGAKVNMTNRVAAATTMTVGAGMKGPGPVVAKPAAAAAKQAL